jgi:signal transduction histidine kinase
MKKIFLLQIFYVVCTVILLSILWEFALEEFLFAHGNEDFNEKVEYVLTTAFFTLLALTYPTYKGLQLISNWKELENTLVDQGLKLEGDGQKKINSLDSMKSVLMSELHRRKKMEKAIDSERQKFFNILDQLPVCFYLQADDYSVPFANKMYKERFGPPESGMCYQVMHKRSELCMPCPTFKVFNSRETESHIWTALDGRTYFTVVTPFEEMNGETLLMEMAIDISNEQKAKDELSRVLEKQEEHIIERTLELEKSNNVLKEFSAFAAHDLKEPLRKIMLFSDRIQEVINVEPGGIGQKYLEGMQRSAQRMNELIEDLLQLSQITSRKLQFKLVDLNAVVTEVVGDLEPSYPGAVKNILFRDLPSVEADRTQMYQLFKNLISNSLKYSKEVEPPKVLIEVETIGDCEYRILIKDNGIGFDEKYKEKIFKPFERLHGRSQYSGTGIGLAICKKVVEFHGGELEVESQVNVGSTFTLCLPKFPKSS